MLLTPEELDRRLAWPEGRSAELAAQKGLPHVLLPDGSVRFEWSEIRPLLSWIDAEPKGAAK